MSMNRRKDLYHNVLTKVSEYKGLYAHGWHIFSQRVRSNAITSAGLGIGDGSGELEPELIEVSS